MVLTIGLDEKTSHQLEQLARVRSTELAKLAHDAIRTFAAEAIVDTGADSTLIPLHILDRIAAPQIDQAYIRGITGIREPVDLYLVTVQIAGLTISGIRAMALYAGASTILGRDALNQLHLALVGTANTTEVYI